MLKLNFYFCEKLVPARTFDFKFGMQGLKFFAVEGDVGKQRVDVKRKGGIIKIRGEKRKKLEK